MFYELQYTFWIAIGLVIYSYVLYPVLIWIASRLFGRNPRRPVVRESDLPAVSVVVAALNEEKMIGARIENILRQNYPENRLEIVVASDGSTDRTNAIASAYMMKYPSRVRLLEFPKRRGKAAVLNEVIPNASTEIVCLSDANTFYDLDAVSKLAPWFSVPTIDAVCGKLNLVNPKTGNNVDGVYWRYENFIKRAEARLGALLGANGAIYAIRRAHYVPIGNDTILDDFMIPLLMRIRHKSRLIYDVEATAHEDTPTDMSEEYGRRVRIGAGGFQSLPRLRALLSPLYGWTWVAFISHKVLRWFCPLFLLVALVTNVMLVTTEIYRVLLYIHIAFYLLALIGPLIPGNYSLCKLLRLAHMFTSMNFALLAGFWRWIKGGLGGAWQRTAR